MDIDEFKYHILSYLESRGYEPKHHKETTENHGTVKEGKFPNRSFGADIGTRLVISEMRMQHIRLQNTVRTRTESVRNIIVYITGMFGTKESRSKLSNHVIEISIPEESINKTGDRGANIHSIMNDLYTYLDGKRDNTFKYQMITYAGPIIGIRAIVT